MVKLRLRVARENRENDPDGSPTRKTLAFELASGSDKNDDNEAVKASSVVLELHGAHEPGWGPFAKSGDVIVTIEPAPPLEAKPARETKPSK